MSQTVAKVQRNDDLERYELAVAGGVAFVTFTRDGDIVSLNHTEVPRSLGGQGIGSALAKGTLDLLRAERRKIIPACSFIRHYIEEHPEYSDLLA